MAGLRTIFMGTPEFSVPCLEKLNEQTEIIAVITQPDKRQGRGQHIVFSPVKQFAVEHGLEVLQPDKIKNDEPFMKKLEEMKPDLIVVVAFGQILPKRVLDIPRLGCVNVHASLLPRYRGAAPMQWSLINGETKTGVTTMLMDVGLDTGDMLLKSEVAIDENMNLEQLHDSLMVCGADLLAETVVALENGTVQPEKQHDELSNYSPMITKDTGKIDWSKDAQTIHDLVRGLDSWPGAYTSYSGKIFKIWQTRKTAAVAPAKPGEIVEINKDGLVVGTGNGLLTITELQAPGKKRMKAADYLRGNKMDVHSMFE